MIRLHSWSGGKDSTCSIILEHINNLPPSKIIFVEVMFDSKRNISGELPEQMEWIHNKAIPQFQKWGYDVEILHSDRDFIFNFFCEITRGNHKGKLRGFPLGGKCAINRDCKTRAVNTFIKRFNGEDYVNYIGIAADETERLKRLKAGQASLLARYGYTEKMAYEICKKYDLLSPVYSFTNRGGCWFCPNQGYRELSYTKQHHPELWAELEQLSHTENLVSQGFKYRKTFAQVNEKVDMIINQG